ncbi:Uncharacterised protein [Candidatus Gugararchaeum adminiculabundum]|nr:Uncharacterised protein [Candidatus Gugararchaeum adminiculabundum]
MMVLKGTREQMLAEIRKNSGEEEALLLAKPSNSLLAFLLNHSKVKKIKCSKGILRTFPKKSVPALAKIGVKLEQAELKNGRPFLHSGIAGKIKQMRSKGLQAKEIAKDLRVPLRTVYWHLNRKN